MQATPSMWNMLKNINWEGSPNLVALSGGERLTDALVEYLLPKVSELWNMYGPTEAPIWCALKKLSLTDPISVGLPIKGMHMEVVDKNWKKLPPYVKGELIIRGVCLADGYVNNLAKTQEKFVIHPKRKTKVYLSGDIACQIENGEFIIFGRQDNQIKLHGYRIELEEIEHCVQKLENIHECAVAVQQDRLIAYVSVAKNAQISEAKILANLQNILPSYMIPHEIIRLKSLPRIASGKVDRKNLPILNVKTFRKKNNSPLLNPMQKILVEIWQDLLHVENIDLKHSFFELGGHSLLAAQLESQIMQKFNKRISLTDFYSVPNIESLCSLINKAPEVSEITAKKPTLKALSWLPLTDFQFLFWCALIVAPELKSLNLIARRRIKGLLNKGALNIALQLVYAKHEVFAYHVYRFIPLQQRRSKKYPQWEFTSLKKCDEFATEICLNASFDELFNYQAWSRSKPNIIARCFNLKDDFVELQISMPHFIADETSLEIFFQDLSKAYLAYSGQASNFIIESTYNYSAYAIQQNENYTCTAQQDTNFWQEYLKDVALYTPKEAYVVNEISSFEHSSYFKVPSKFFIQLWQFCATYGCTASEALCAASALALINVSDCNNIKHNILVNIVKSTRKDIELRDVIGCFLQNELLKLNISKTTDLLSLTKQVQKSIEKTRAYQEVTSLIKIAAIGKIKTNRLTIKSCARILSLTLLAKFAKLLKINPTLLTACKTISRFEKKNNFFVNVNIFSNFFAAPDKLIKQKLFNKELSPVPFHMHDKIKIKDQIEICFLREEDTNPYLVISANLKEECRQKIGACLLQNILNVHEF
ncbi:MAG: hypothetical protein A3F18_02280 [Legionellales bacterium RIFCSPHIGHO2_12_FULL_37_14]|nr:MAG: hypothetical protein A3F18_02280 [Legionellales bacterium RIFCSPHIGHO2_12_FULL_37_14]